MSSHILLNLNVIKKPIVNYIHWAWCSWFSNVTMFIVLNGPNKQVEKYIELFKQASRWQIRGNWLYAEIAQNYTFFCFRSCLCFGGLLCLCVFLLVHWVFLFPLFNCNLLFLLYHIRKILDRYIYTQTLFRFLFPNLM